MSKEKQGKRFVQIFAEDCGFFGPESSLVVDTETGVTYLIIRNTFGSGITPLLNADGKPIGGILPRVIDDKRGYVLANISRSCFCLKGDFGFLFAFTLPLRAMCCHTII